MGSINDRFLRLVVTEVCTLNTSTPKLERLTKFGHRVCSRSLKAQNANALILESPWEHIVNCELVPTPSQMAFIKAGFLQRLRPLDLISRVETLRGGSLALR